MAQNEIGLIILAAGASIRLGKPKQLLNFKGKTLLRRIACESLASVCRPVIVVLGANGERFKDELKDYDVYIARNSHWEEGMGSSIQVGLRKLLEINKAVSGVIIAVCDQPFVTSEVINKLFETFEETKAPIIASAYQETQGVPALFSAKLFPQLLDLKSGGAQKIINQYKSETVGVPFEKGAIDIDTPQDYEEISSKYF